MQTVATTDVSGICQSVMWLHTTFRCAYGLKRINILLRRETLVDLRNIVLDGVPISPMDDSAFAKLLWPLVVAYSR